MTPRDLFAGLTILERKYRKEFRAVDLDRLWRDLLALDRAAFEKAVGRIKYSCRWMPEVDYLVMKAREWQGSRNYAILPVSKPSGVEGREVFDLLKLFQAGEMEEREYVAELYRMSERWGKSCYARQAYEREAAMAKEGKATSGMLFG
ncbi:MAG TPA: hypothetical protein VI298_08605 [Geobacteraceae bacterium]